MASKEAMWKRDNSIRKTITMMKDGKVVNIYTVAAEMDCSSRTARDYINIAKEKIRIEREKIEEILAKPLEVLDGQ